ncbi:MAG: fumarylacetoacetate hydrolase family protein [Bacteroidota bacterium]
MNKNVAAAAKRLREAEAKKRLCEPIRNLIGATDIEKAYAVQEINTALRMAQGARIVGRKIGLTAPVVQHQLGVNQPDFGMLWQDKEVMNGGEISMRELMQPRAEAEIAFVLGQDLDAKHLTSIDILSAIDYALAAIEIVGSRIKNWDIKITDTIADNASASHWVVGHQPVKLDQIDLLNCKMLMTNKGKKVSEGLGKNCLGSPINATLWLAQKLAQMGRPMKAGEVIFTGALGPMVSAKAGDEFHVSIEGAGEVSVQFIA